MPLREKILVPFCFGSCRHLNRNIRQGRLRIRISLRNVDLEEFKSLKLDMTQWAMTKITATTISWAFSTALSLQASR